MWRSQSNSGVRLESKHGGGGRGSRSGGRSRSRLRRPRRGRAPHGREGRGVPSAATIPAAGALPPGGAAAITMNVAIGEREGAWIVVSGAKHVSAGIEPAEFNGLSARLAWGHFVT